MNRRELLISLSVMPAVLACEPSFEELVQSKLCNGIDKIFKVINLANGYKTSVPAPTLEYRKLDEINDYCWQTVITASIKKSKYPIISSLNFLRNQATDVFVDYQCSNWFNYIFISECKIHLVDLKQYIPFYTNSLKQKIGKYNSSIFIAANLSKESAIIPVKNNCFGCCIMNEECFHIGQI